MKYTYHIGDVVVVRNDLIEYDHHYYMYHGDESNIVNEEMMDYRGKSYRIVDIECGQYRLEGSLWGWVDEMFAGLADVSTPNVDALLDIL